MSDGFHQIVSEKLEKNNYPAWKFRMTNFLKGKGYWDYVDGDNEVAPETPERNATTEQKKALKDWQQGQSKVMYWLSMSITDGMMGYLQEAETPAIAWRNLGRVFEVNTKARKLQLKSELNQVSRNNLSINDYALKIKSIVEALGSIQVAVEDDDIVCACLDGLGEEYVHFRSSMNTRDDIPEFTDLISMLILEEKNLGLDASSSQGKNKSEHAFYSSSSRGRGRGRGQGGGRGQNREGQSNQGYTGGRGNQSRGRGSQRG